MDWGQGRTKLQKRGGRLLSELTSNQFRKGSRHMFYKKSHDSMADYSTSDFPKKNFNFDKAAHKSERSVSRIVVTFLRISDFSAVAVRRPFCFFPIWPLSAAGTFGDFFICWKGHILCQKTMSHSYFNLLRVFPYINLLRLYVPTNLYIYIYNLLVLFGSSPI